MTILEQLQKEAREKYYRTFSSISPSTTDAYLDQLITHVYTTAIEEARKIVKGKKKNGIGHYEDGEEYIDDSEGAYAWDEALDDVAEDLKALLYK
jgi:hypothetical protein